MASPSTFFSRRPNWPALGLILMASLLPRAWALYQNVLDLNQRIASGAELPLRALGGSDVPGWFAMAQYLRPGYWFLGARPPLFPLTIRAVLLRGGGPVEATVLQMLFGALIPLVAYALARRLFERVANLERPDRLAFWVGLIVALDPASVVMSATLMSESLFNLLFTLFFFSLLVYAQNERLRDLLLACLWLALAMLTRPTAIFLWIVAPLPLIVSIRRWWRPALVIAGVGLAVYLGWSARNLQYQGVFTYSLQTNYHLLFYRALAAEYQATGADADDLYTTYVRDLYQATGKDASDVDANTFYSLISVKDPGLYHEMGRLALEKLRRYWIWAVLGMGPGLWRMLSLSNRLPRWSRPFELAYHAALYGLAALGAWLALRRREWQLLVFTGLPIVYITGLTLLSQVSGMDTRMRTPMTAMIGTLAVYGGSQLAALLRQRRA